MTVELVQKLLDQLGLGCLVIDTATPILRRNDSWSGITTSGAEVFVKRISTDDPSRYRRACIFEILSGVTPIPGLTTPHCHGWDDTSQLQVFQWVRDAEIATDLLYDGRLTCDLAQRVGVSLAALHTTVPASGLGLERVDFPLPTTEWLAALPSRMYDRASAGELQVWRMLQQDESLAPAIARLRADENAAAATMIHGDVRLDQILVDVRGGVVHLTDWEEFRIGDPARDTGAFVGDLLCHAASRALRNTSGSASTPVGERADISTTDIAAELARIQPVLRAFWRGYRVNGNVGDELAHRTVAFAGWHTYDRLIAQAQRSARVSAVARGVAGMGRNLLRDPGRFLTTLGLGKGR